MGQGGQVRGYHAGVNAGTAAILEGRAAKPPPSTMVQRYTRFENKPITGKSVLAVLVARKLGAANDPATPEAAKL